MLEKLLRIKHWQLFLLILVPIVSAQVIMGMAFAMRQSADVNFIFLLFPVLLIVMILVLFSWLYAIIFKLRDKMPSEVNLPYGRIQLFLYIPAIFFMLISFLMMSAFSNDGFFFRIAPDYIVFIIPFHLLSMFGMFHTIYFAGKTMKCVETQKNQSFSDFAGEFFLIWFNIIGIWFLQPRLNNIISNETIYSNDLLDDDVL